MKALIQRVSRADVTIAGKTAGHIQKGILVFLGVEKGDTEKDLAHIVKKVVSLRVFSDNEGRMNLSVKDIGGEVLVVSQFTLAADCRKGSRPSFDKAEFPEKAKAMYEQAIAMISREGITVASGEFAADMRVSLVNDGPVTFLVDSAKAAQGTA
jgi:D-tyrosyl-tRNA(Tyr) deacylase